MSPHLAARRGGLVALCVSLVLGVLSGCSAFSDPGASGPRAASASDTAGARPLRMRTRVTRVLGTLSHSEREAFERHAERVIAGYVSAAYLHERPGTAYRGSFPGFTPGARALALRDTGVVSDRGFAAADEVRPRGAVSYVSVVAPDGRPVGATARVWVKLLVTDGDERRQVAVHGRLLLTPAQGRWRIFGYDLALGSGAARSAG